MITNLEIRSYKNLHKLKIECSQINKIYGQNGVGKTSIKEAIEFLLTGKVNKKKPSLNCSVAGMYNGVKIIRKIDKGQETILMGAKEVEQTAVQELTGVNYDELISIFGLGFMKLDEEDKHALLSNIFPSEQTCEGLIKEFYQEYFHPEDTGLSFMDDEAWIGFTDSYAINSPEAMEKALEKVVRDRKKEYDYNKGELAATLESLAGLGDEGKAEKSDPELVEKVAKLKKKIALAQKYNRMPFHDKLLEMLKIEPFDFDKANQKKAEAKTKWEQLRADLQRLIDLKDKCPTCGQKTKEVDWKEVEKEKKKLSEEKKLYASLQVDQEMKIENAEERIKNAIQDKISKWQKILAPLETILEGIQQSAKLVEFKKQQKQELEQKKEQLETTLEEYSYEFEEKLLKFVKKIPLKLTESIVKDIEEALGEGFKLVLLEKNKTNENYKKVFKLYQNDVEYNFLSMGQKMYVDLTFARVVARAKKKFKIIFLDNAESYTGQILKFSKIAQIFVAYARKKTPLTIENL